MNAYRARPLNFPWPPIIYGLAAVIAFGTGYLFPVYTDTLSNMYVRAAGVLIMAGGISLDLWAVVTLFRQHTTVLPNRCSSRLVTSGPFRLTRNPVYLGYTLTMFGLGLLSANPWFFAAGLIAAVITQFLAIRAEEMHLLSRFGFEFERYCNSARRWI